MKKPPVIFLLALWGESYIKNFFRYSLRSLLAPGNIPAMCKDYECSFLFLTTESDVSFFKEQPEYHMLESFCSVEFVEISDLIFEGCYSATLTLAFERGMRTRGNKMCETYFFYLVSDYILADGSLRNLKRYLASGCSAITTGNFLVIEEYFADILQSFMQTHEKGLIVLNAREILSLAFRYLHPVSTAQTVTQPFTHATHANRLFWKVNETTMIGRFYLRHMLCIKPEIEDFIIGSSCDYSFVAEMCPSGKIIHIQDSDDYCVIEMAPFDYEKTFIRPGPYESKKLAKHFSEWTTSLHRANAHFPIIYHSETLQKPPIDMLQKSAEYIGNLEKLFCEPPQPVRGHPYWISCVESICFWLHQQKNKTRYFAHGTIAGVLGSTAFYPPLGKWNDDHFFLKATNPPSVLPLSRKQKRRMRIKSLMAGSTFHTAISHLNWYDEHKIKKRIHQIFNKNNNCLLIAFEPIPEVIQWLDSAYPNACSFHYYDFFRRKSPEMLRKLLGNQRKILIWLSEEHFSKLGVVIRQCYSYLPPEGSISVILRQKKEIFNERLKSDLAVCFADLHNAHIACEKIDLTCSIARLYLRSLTESFLRCSFAPKRSFLERVVGMLGLSLLNPITVFGNILSWSGILGKKKTTSATLHFKYKSSSL